MAEAAVFLAIAQGALALKQSMDEQKALVEGAEAEQEELARQQQEVNRRSQEDQSDRARAADKQFASAIVAMEAMGGAGSQSDTRKQMEISGTTGIDLARIEGNRRREVKALQSRIGAVRAEAKGAIKASQMKFLSSVLSLGGGVLGDKAARPGDDTPTGGGSGIATNTSQASPRATTFTGSRAQ